MSTTIDELNVKISANSESASRAMERLANSLDKLVIPTSKAITSISALTDVLNYLTSTIFTTSGGLNSLASGMSQVGSSFSGGTKSFQQYNAVLQESANSMNQFNVQNLTLKLNMKEVKDNTEEAKTGMDNFVSAMSKINSVGNTVNRVLGRFIALIGARALGGGLANAVNIANEYVESQNLFEVAMGSSAKRAYDWSEEVSSALGIDPAEMRKNMGYFKQMSDAMGMVEKQAYTVSKNLTQLSYDISSLYNISTEKSFLKVKSALAGKIFCPICKGLHIVISLIHGKLSSNKAIC